jgi:hypothetical protein
LQLIEAEGLRELCRGRAHRGSLTDAITVRAGLLRGAFLGGGSVSRLPAARPQLGNRGGPGAVDFAER